LALSSLRFSNGSTAMDLAGTAAVTGAVSAGRRSRNLSASSSATAAPSAAMIQRSSLRPVWRVIDWLRSTSLSSLRPCGVIS
jgi:hypothetical protein